MQQADSLSAVVNEPLCIKLVSQWTFPQSVFNPKYILKRRISRSEHNYISQSSLNAWASFNIDSKFVWSCLKKSHGVYWNHAYILQSTAQSNKSSGEELSKNETFRYWTEITGQNITNKIIPQFNIELLEALIKIHISAIANLSLDSILKLSESILNSNINFIVGFMTH